MVACMEVEVGDGVGLWDQVILKLPILRKL